MSTNVILPEMGENIESGTIMKVLVAVGDSLQKDQSILEIETDKAVVEVPTPYAGTVAEIRVNDGEDINVGDIILVITEGAAAPEAKELEPVAEPEPVPESLQAPEPEAAAPAPRRTAPTPPTPIETQVAATVTVAATTLATEPIDTRAASPSVRRLAREIGVDLAQVRPVDGVRITIEDVKAHANAANATAPSVAERTPTARVATPLPDFTRWGEVSREGMSRIRRRTAERLSEAWTTIPHVTQNDKADITELEVFRKKFGPEAAKRGGKLTATAILVKVLALGLERFPEFNASIDVANNEFIYKKYFNVGVAVDTDRGLLVPVIKDVDKKDLVDISVELGELSERARTRKTTLEEMQGGCITITNLGGIGGVHFTPIVNPPEVAILGVSRATLEPVYIEGELAPRMLMPLSLSYDHRVIDGANAARFTRWVCEVLEAPLTLLMNSPS